MWASQTNKNASIYYIFIIFIYTNVVIEREPHKRVFVASIDSGENYSIAISFYLFFPVLDESVCGFQPELVNGSKKM